MIKNFKYICINLIAIEQINQTPKPIEEIKFIEENLINNYGTIILKEYIQEKGSIVYICVKDGLTSVININEKNFTIQSVRHNKYFIKKKISHPKFILSTGPLNFKNEYLKKKYVSNINITPIIGLVKDWNIEIYKQILEIINETFLEILN
jgi:hypothetical protein